ncbi:unnamed protein product [Ectocarpus fasciculatus]
MAAAALPSSISYIGRFDHSQSSPRCDWSGSGITFHVTNEAAASSTLSVTLSVAATSTNFLSVLVNCEVLGKYEISPELGEVKFSFEQTPGSTYEINVVKVTEASQGVVSFEDLVVDGGYLASGVDRSCRNKNDINLLFIGDSITAAYGVEGTNPCSFSPDTENILDSYATLVANDIGAELHTIAWSGKGVVRNYGDEQTTSADPMPIYYNRTLGEYDDTSLTWNPRHYLPDVVMVMLGANDYSTTPYPSDEDFINGLVGLLSQIYRDYPNAKVGAMCSAEPDGNQCTNIEQAAKLTSSTYVKIDDSVYVSYGCDYHPSIETQRNIADIVTPVVQEMLTTD